MTKKQPAEARMRRKCVGFGGPARRFARFGLVGKAQRTHNADLGSRSCGGCCLRCQSLNR